MLKSKANKTTADSPPEKESLAAAVAAAPDSAASPNGAPRTLADKIKELVRLAREQGRLTYSDIDEILAETSSPEEMDEVFAKLRSLEVEVVDQADVDRVKPADAEEDKYPVKPGAVMWPKEPDERFFVFGTGRDEKGVRKYHCQCADEAQAVESREMCGPFGRHS